MSPSFFAKAIDMYMYICVHVLCNPLSFQSGRRLDRNDEEPDQRERSEAEDLTTLAEIEEED